MPASLVVLDITTVGEPDPGRGGISDPGDHSPDSSLPLMRRRASTLAGPQTAVFVDGKRFEVPVKISSGPFVAHEGYLTEGHIFGAIRAGTISYRLKTKPARMAVGEQWILEGDGRVIIYRIENNGPDGKLRIARTDAPGESIEAFATGDGLRITRIGHLADGRPQGGLDLAFDEAGHFSFAMEGETIVSGSAEAKREAGTAVITLSPTQPDWAAARQVRVTCSRDGDLCDRGDDDRPQLARSTVTPPGRRRFERASPRSGCLDGACQDALAGFSLSMCASCDSG